MKMMNTAKRIELAAVLWGWKPHPTQRQWLLDDHQVKVAACGRRWGKTEAAAVDVATYAISNNGSTQIIVAPTYDQSKLIARTVERLLLSNPHTRRHVKVAKTPYTEILFRSSRIMARTADEDGRNLRGHSADRVVVDEAAFVRDEVIEEVIGPMLADRNGKLVLISTPFRKNHFYRAFIRGNRGQLQAELKKEGYGINSERAQNPEQENQIGYRSFRFPSWENPYICRQYIEAQRRILTDRQFKVEYEAEFVDDQNSVFAWEDIRTAVCTRQINFQSMVCVAGIDWARYSDYTAVVVLAIGDQPSAVTPAYTSPQYHVVAVDRFNRMEWKFQVERVADMLCRFGVRAIAADQTSIGDPLLENLKDILWEERRLDVEIEGIVFTNQIKRELIDNLAIHLARHELSFPYIEHLIRELQFYEYELTESGNVRTGARRGYTDDCVCALALALRIAPRYLFGSNFSTTGNLRDSVRGW